MTRWQRYVNRSRHTRRAVRSTSHGIRSVPATFVWSVAFLVVLPLATLLADDFAPRTPVVPGDLPAEQPRGEFQPPPENLFEPAKIVATVGDEHILAGDVLPSVNQALEPYAGKAPQSELEKQRVLLMKQLLLGMIETKLLYLDFLRLAPPEKVPEIHKNIHTKFDETRVPELLQKTKLATAAELDAKLRFYGSSLSKSRRLFTEQVLAQSMVGRNIKQNPEVTHEEMLVYYRDHAADYEVPAKARWEELMTQLDKFPDRDQAWRALAALGNEVLRGARFDAVAMRGSQGFTADQGGYHDWTTKGSLVSKVVDEAIFTLPEGTLSRILEDERGLYIIRVIERREAGRIPFTQAQVEIKPEIIQQKVDKDRQAYLQKLRKRTPVWTIFDEPGAPLFSPIAAAP